jgi:hypothetical protein
MQEQLEEEERMVLCKTRSKMQLEMFSFFSSLYSLHLHFTVTFISFEGSVDDAELNSKTRNDDEMQGMPVFSVCSLE